MLILFRQAHGADSETCHGVFLGLACTKNSMLCRIRIRRCFILLDGINAQGVSEVGNSYLEFIAERSVLTPVVPGLMHH